MLSDNLVEDVVSLEEEMASRSSNSSKSSSSDDSSCSSEAGLNGAELNGKEAAGDLLQLSRDNIILAVSKGASRSVADELNKQHMIIQNRFRCHLGTKVLPELISTINQSTSSSADLLPDIPVITIDFKKFVDDLKYMLGHNNEIPALKAHHEARAIQSFIENLDFRAKGFKDETLNGFRKRMIELQRLFIYYLSSTDADSRIEKLMSLQTYNEHKT